MFVFLCRRRLAGLVAEGCVVSSVEVKRTLCCERPAHEVKETARVGGLEKDAAPPAQAATPYTYNNHPIGYAESLDSTCVFGIYTPPFRYSHVRMTY